MVERSGFGTTGNLAANANGGAPAQDAGGQPAQLGANAFRQVDGPQPPAPLQGARVNVPTAARGGVQDRAQVGGGDNLDGDDRSSIFSDDSSSVETVLIGYPGVEGTRGLTHVSTTRTRLEVDNEDADTDDSASVETVLIGYPGVEGTRGLTHVYTTRTRLEVDNEDADSDDSSSVETVLIGYPGVEGTRGLTHVSTTRTRLEVDNEDDASDFNSIVEVDNEDGDSDFNSIIEVDDQNIPSVANGGIPESDFVRSLDFIDYRRVELPDGERLSEPLSYADRERQRRGAPATFEELPIPPR